MTATLAPAVEVAPPVLDFEAQLAETDVVMTGRLAMAGLALDVNAAAPVTVVDFANVVSTPTPAPDLSATPVAALLQRARVRILRDGWCRDAARTSGGAMCLTEAIRAEARSHAEEGEARILLRRALGGGDSIPEMNRRLTSAAHAAAALDTATAMAAQQTL